jgi:hypothetical protein
MTEPHQPPTDPVLSALQVLTQLTAKNHEQLKSVLIAVTGIFILLLGMVLALWVR